MVVIAGQRCGGWDRTCTERDPATKSCRRYAERARCREFGDAVRFCIDRYEYPNAVGTLPALLVTFEQARAACDAEGKRLCTGDEWTFACEGPEGFPFSHGVARRANACNLGALEKRIPPERFWRAREVSALVSEHDRRAPIGSTIGCASPFGVHDLLGNVAEWVVSASERPHVSALKGGGFTDSAAECREILKIRTKGYRAFPVGFRCCADTFARPPPAVTPPP
jgi:formylglycine-generating enzyme required for sulfatase activity